MFTISKRTFLLGLLPLCSAALTLPAQAQDGSSRPIRLVVPTAAGQATDVVARLFAEHLGKELGQTIIVDNRPGASGIIAMDIAKNASADGHTLLMGVTSTLAVNPNVFAKLSYTPDDFIPVAHLTSQPLFLVASAKSGIQDLAGLVSQAKSKPGVLNYGSSGAGSTQRIAMEMLKFSKDLDLTHILYKSSPQMIAELMAGTIDVAFESAPLILPLQKNSRVQFLAVSTPQRSSLAPDIPSLQELGVAGFDASVWTMLMVKAGTPQPVVVRLQTALQKIMASDVMLTALRAQASEPGKTPPPQLTQFLRDQVEFWGKQLRRINILPS